MLVLGRVHEQHDPVLRMGDALGHSRSLRIFPRIRGRSVARRFLEDRRAQRQSDEFGQRIAQALEPALAVGRNEGCPDLPRRDDHRHKGTRGG
jgi:hypothetical protein